MLQTSTITGQIAAQGRSIRSHIDGRVTISTDDEMLSGWPVARFLKAALTTLAQAFSALNPQQACLAIGGAKLGS